LRRADGLAPLAQRLLLSDQNARHSGFWEPVSLEPPRQSRWVYQGVVVFLGLGGGMLPIGSSSRRSSSQSTPFNAADSTVLSDRHGSRSWMTLGLRSPR
jgi:hypothetical protein